MTRTPAFLNRVLSLIFGLALVLGGLVLLDHRFGVVRDWPQRADLSGVRDVLGESWLPWVAGALGLLLVVLGLWLLLAQLRRTTIGGVRLTGSDSSGQLETDAGSLSSVVSSALENSEGIESARVNVVQRRGEAPMVLARATLDPRTDGPSLVASAQDYDRSVREAFAGQVGARLLIERPRPRRGRATAPARVQ